MDEQRVPVSEEVLELGKRQRQTAIVRVETSTHEDEVPFEADLATDEVVVERVAVDRFVATPVPDRWEGETLVISVMEEVVVVEKRLKVVEEIRVSRKRRSRHVRRTATRRRQQVVIRRDEIDG
jgi:stress response protein YsnF